MTGFFFPMKAIVPPHIVGAISLVVLAVALFALYGRQLAGPVARWSMSSLPIMALYLNVFVGVVQSFGKVDLSATSSRPPAPEPPFAVAQAIVLILFMVMLASLAARRYHPALSA